MSEAFTQQPSWTTQAHVHPNVFSADFGDGYVQEAPNGINNAPLMWDLAFNRVTTAMAVSAVAFLRARAQDRSPFFWRPPVQPYDAIGLYRLHANLPGNSSRSKEFDDKVEAYNSRTVTCSFIEDFTPFTTVSGNVSVNNGAAVVFASMDCSGVPTDGTAWLNVDADGWKPCRIVGNVIATGVTILTLESAYQGVYNLTAPAHIVY